MRAKVEIMPFNPAKIEDDLPAVADWSAYDLSGSFSSNPSNGDSSLSVTGFSGAPPAGAVIRCKNGSTYSDVYQLTSATASTFVVKPQIFESSFTFAGSTIEVLPHFDITEWVDNISYLENEFDLSFSHQFRLPKPVTINVSNVTKLIYDRINYTVSRSALYSSGAYVSTRADSGVYDNCYVAISINASGINYKVFAGKISAIDSKIDEKDRSASLYLEPVMFGAKDIKLKDVDEIYQGHWYSTSSFKTKTVSGKNLDIIAKIFRQQGIRKRYFNVVNKEKTAGACVLTLDVVPYIDKGEYITVSGVDSATVQFDGSHRVTEVDNLNKLVYFTFGTDTVASTSVSVTNGLAAWRVVFDQYTDYKDETIDSLTYTIADDWTIVPRWQQDIVENDTTWNHLKNFCVKYAAVADMDFSSGIAKGYFRSRNRTELRNIILTRDDFVREFEITPNWKEYKENGVEVRSTVTLYEQDDNQDSLTLTNNRGKFGGAVIASNNKGTSNAATTISNPALQDYDAVKFQNHDATYSVTSSIFSPRLQEAVKRSGVFYIESDSSVELKYPEIFFTKLKMPYIYVAGATIKFLSSSTGLVTGYTSQSVLSGDITNAIGVTGIVGIPHYRLSSAAYTENPLGAGVFTTEENAGDDRLAYINGPGAENYYETALDDYNGNGFRYISAGIVFKDSDDSVQEDGGFKLIIYASTDDTTVNDSTANYLKRFELTIANGGASWATTDTGSSHIYKFTVDEKNKLTHANLVLAASSSVYGVFVRSSPLDPNFDDNVYFTDNYASYSATARFLKKMPCYGERTLSGVLTSGTPIGGNPRQLSWGCFTGVSTLYWADQSTDKVYVASNTTNWDDVTNVVGGSSGTPPARGASAGATNFTLPNPTGCFRLYDHALICASLDDNKVYYVNLSTATATCIADNATDGISSPGQIFAFDFIQSWYDTQYALVTAPSTYQGAHMDDVQIAAEKYQPFFSDKTRRMVKCAVKMSNSKIAYRDIHIGDLLELDSTAISQTGGLNTAFYVLRKRMDVRRHVLEMWLLEQGEVTTYEEEPTSQPTNLVFSNIDDDQMDVSWTGNGSDGYLVLMKSNTTITDFPTDGIVYSTTDTIGASQVVYSGSSTSFTASGLTLETLYHFAVFAFNGAGAAINYRVTLPLKGSQYTYDTEPANQPTGSNINLSNVAGATLKQSFSFTASSGGSDMYLVLRKSGGLPTGTPTDGTSYIAGDTIGDGTVIQVGVNTFGESTGLSGNTNYGYAVFAFNGGSGRENYKTGSPLTGSLTTLFAEPADNPTVSIVSRTDSVFSIELTPSGSPDGHVVTYTPFSGNLEDLTLYQPVDGNNYSINSVLGGDTKVGYIGVDTEFDITGLSADQDYFIAAFAYNGSGSQTNFNTSDSPGTDYDTTLAVEPASHPTTLSILTSTETTVSVSITPSVSGEKYIFAVAELGDL